MKGKWRITLLILFFWSSLSYSQESFFEPTDVEREESTKTKVNPEQNFLEMAINYINEKNYASARRYLQLAQNSGDEKIYQDSIVWNMYIDSLEGKKNMDSSLNSLPDDMAAKALYYISDGWQTYFEKNPEVKDIYLMSIEYKEKLIARYPNSDFSTMATQQLVPLFINERNYDKALVYLLKYLDNNKTGKKTSDDKAWFYLGQILENSTEYRDLHKAIQSYQRVMKNPESLFYDQAKNRISNIEKFYHIIQ